jgi:putative FmdB family regulatory protein
MPIYEYRCLRCGSDKFERIRSVSACGQPAQCPTCLESAYQIVSAPGGIRANGAGGGMVLSEKQMKMIKEPVWQDEKTGAITAAH